MRTLSFARGSIPPDEEGIVPPDEEGIVPHPDENPTTAIAGRYAREVRALAVLTTQVLNFSPTMFKSVSQDTRNAYSCRMLVQRDGRVCIRAG